MEVGCFQSQCSGCNWKEFTCFWSEHSQCRLVFRHFQAYKWGLHTYWPNMRPLHCTAWTACEVNDFASCVFGYCIRCTWLRQDTTVIQKPLGNDVYIWLYQSWPGWVFLFFLMSVVAECIQLSVFMNLGRWTRPQYLWNLCSRWCICMPLLVIT